MRSRLYQVLTFLCCQSQGSDPPAQAILAHLRFAWNRRIQISVALRGEADGAMTLSHRIGGSGCSCTRPTGGIYNYVQHIRKLNAFAQTDCHELHSSLLLILLSYNLHVLHA
ncbi:hypothetical protein DFJ58DRAFT_490182 [Suillus subalutaceus]|uniref:uncharacterized protein n=1 Tax=Suillus subalutaceus TaxID=48586 RepID=UPI001B879E0B|nr:uncharacterized protein DFJ58DRAFT_490182 [Suillus subalutaceus]KAG1846576.1 hypothetical protein DFJ58DRAFT_490182 [Suillus subalutaceus]